MDETRKYDKHESKENYKRRTKALKNKETYEKNGKMSSKHLRIQEALKNSKKL